MAYVEKQPSMLEKIAELLKIMPNSENKIKPLVNNNDRPFDFLNPVHTAEASMNYPTSVYNQNIQITPDQIIREGVNKHTSGDYTSALKYFLRAKSMSGNKDLNLDDYIFRTQRLIEEINKRGIK